MSNLFTFFGGASGEWRVTAQSAYRGPALANVTHLAIRSGKASAPDRTLWTLSGVTSNVRYATAAELRALRARQEGLGRPEAKCAALIPIRKNDAWWNLAQDERRRIFEESSHHNAIGSEYLPAIARRLHHCRDLGGEFDFLTWFEFAPQHREAFSELLGRLRRTPEWQYVEREVEIHLERA